MTTTARDIRARADDLRRHRTALAARCRSTAWHSRGATEFQHRADGTLARLDACAHALDQAAAALERHAETAHRRIAELAAVPAAIEHAGAGLVAGIGTGLTRAAHRMARP